MERQRPCASSTDVAKQLIQPVGGILVRTREWSGQPLGGLAQRPVGVTNPGSHVLPGRSSASCREAACGSPIDGVGRWDVAEAEVESERVAIESA